MTDLELVLVTKDLVQKERELTLKVLHHLKEIEKRRIFAKRGFSSLFEFVVKELGYTESQAYKRISAMRFLKDFPELEEKISLSHAAKFQQFFSKEKCSKEKKLELIEKLSSKSLRDCEKELRTLSPKAMPKQKVVTIDQKFSSLSFVVDEKVMQKLEKFKEKYSRKLQGESLAEVFEVLLDQALKEKPTKSRTTTGLRKSRYVPVSLKKKISREADNRCQYIDKISGRRCEAKKYLEFDHIKPFAMGGSTEEKNLRLYCNTHNKLVAIQHFGKTKMGRYLRI